MALLLTVHRNVVARLGGGALTLQRVLRIFWIDCALVPWMGQVVDVS